MVAKPKKARADRDPGQIRAARESRGLSRGQLAARLKLANYPVLRLLTWSTPAATTISPKVAFALYEREWAHVDVAALEPGEARLLRDLAERFGQGVVAPVPSPFTRSHARAVRDGAGTDVPRLERPKLFRLELDEKTGTCRLVRVRSPRGQERTAEPLTSPR